MPGLNEILNTIQRTNDEKAEEIIRAAEKDGREIVSKEQRSAEAQAQALVKKAEKRLEREYDSSVSSLYSSQNRALLSAKVDAVNSVVAEALARLENLPDEEYFDMIFSLAKEYAAGDECVMRLSEKDLKRLPKGFSDRLGGCKDTENISVCTKPFDIKNGFVLDFGETCENCTLDAIVRDREQTLRDEIAALLFEKAV